MRKTLLALFLALAACVPAFYQATAMDGFDLGEMPPLPPPLLDDSDSAPLLAPPGSGLDSPLNLGDITPGASLMPPPAMAPTPPPSLPSSIDDAGQGASVPTTPAPGGYSPPMGGYGGPSGGDFSGTPLPPPPPLAPLPIDEGVAPAQTRPLAPQTTTDSAAASSSLAPPPLPAQPSDAQTVTGLADNEIPRPGQITGGRVNVRAGPNTQYESVAVLTTGTPLTVLAKNGDWYKIMYPAEHLASIHKKFVTAEVPSEIPEEGVAGVVNQDDTDVHAFYWDKSTVVGKLTKGAPVIVKQERGQWYRIVAPLNARAYVFAKYVKLDADAPVVADTAPLPPSASVDLTATAPDGSPAPKAKVTPEEEKVRELKEERAKQLQVELEKMREQEEILRQRELARVQEFERRQKEAEEMVKARAQADLQARMLQASQLEAAIRDLDARLGAIDGEKARQASIMGRRFGQTVNPATIVGSAAGWAPPDPPSGYVGWVENIGRVGGAPSPFRLTKGGEIRFWLVSDNFDLDKFTNLRVLCTGDVIHAGGTTASILKVNNIRPLTEWEIAGGMSGIPQAMGRPAPQARPGGRPGPVPGPQQQRREEPYVDRYANATDVTDYNQPGFERPPPSQPQGNALDRDPFASYGGSAPMPQYGTGYGTPYTPPAGDPYGGQQYGYGGGYGGAQRPSVPDDDNVGTADLVTSVEAVFGSGYTPAPAGAYSVDSYGSSGTTTTYGGGYDASYGSYDSYGGGGEQFPNAQPATGLVRPSDPTQLPDTVGGIGSYSTSGSIVSGQGVGMRMGEVETDVYERPIINEIIP